jgi:homoserine kinase type II
VTAALGRTQKAKLAAIAAHFALGEIRSYSQISQGTNHNYLVITPQGEYLFKMIVNTTIEDILHGMPFLERLEACGFTATAYYLKSPRGEVAYQSADANAVVLRKLPGGTPELSPAVCREIGAQLAQLHLIPCGDLPKKRHWLDAHYLPETVQKALKLHGPEKLRETRMILASLRDFQPASFPQAIIHGDLYPANTLFERERLVAFIDWQDIGVGAAMIDFVQTVQGFCFVDQGERSEYWALFDPELYRALYESYTSIRPFSAYELSHLDAAMKYVGLTQPVWSMLMWEQYHPGQELVETNLMYWKYGLDRLTLPQL